MVKRILLYFVVMVILLGVALSAGQWDKDTTILQQNAGEIGGWLASRESEALDWVKKHEPVLQSLASGRPGAMGAALQEEASKDYTILVHEGDSIRFWTNTKCLPGKADFAKLRNIKGRMLLRVPLGTFLVRQESERLTILIPVRYNLDALSNHPFPADKNITGETSVADAATSFPVLIDGKPFCWLESGGMARSSWLQGIQLLFYLLFVAVLLALTSMLSDWLSGRYGRISGALLSLVVVGALMGLVSGFDFTGRQFGAIALFARKFDSPSLIGSSLGEWLINICLLVWLMLSFHRLFRSDRFDQAPSAVRYAVAATSYLITMSSVWFCTEILHQLVFHSRINFDFDNILNLNRYSLLAIGGMLLLFLGLFIFNHRIMQTVRNAALPLQGRAVVVGAVTAIFAMICALGAGPDTNLLQVVIFGILYTVVFDAYVHWESPGFGWIVCWLLLLSLFSASLLFRLNHLKNLSDRMAYANALVVERDTVVAERLLPLVYTQLRQDSQQLNVLLKPWPFKALASDLRDHFNSIVIGHPYLFQHYRLTVYAFDREHQPILLGQTGDYNSVVQESWNRGVALPGTAGVRYYTDADGRFRYMMAFNALRMNDPGHPTQVYCFLDHEYPKPTRVYAQLFYNTSYKNLGQLRNYDFAVRRNNKLLVELGQSNRALLDSDLQNGTAREVETAEPNRIDAVAKSADGRTVSVVGRRSGGWYKEVYLFSILFTLASVFLFLLALANSYLGFLHDYFHLSLTTKGSLAKRIHFWNVTLIAVAFLIIGLMTYRHFTMASKESERANLDFRSEAVLTNLKIQLVNSSLSADSLRRTLPKTLSTIASSLSMDASLYAPSGLLVFTTQEDLAGLGLLSPVMNPIAMEALKQGTAFERVEAEHTAGFEYFTKYLPLRNNQNQLLGFLGVPYMLSDRRAGAEVSDFIGMLASLYVFLLLIAYAVTFLLARSIIRPVSLISDKIRELRLEDKNIPLEYKGDSQDELSELIAQYNRMVDKLEDSKVQMIRLEREGAWREMARQVAHDIKNPLTTMKLSMQQLERVSSNPEQAAAYLRKAITRLIEQIDSLAQIASEFSMFANLDIREKHDMVLNEVVENVHDLFSEQKNVDLELSLPSERFHILGDKNHLIRVFNNLVINAIQAIPSDRRGQIRVSLYRQDKYAVVRIGDNGGGIPAEIQQRVFEPNFTTKTSGSGLGLAICKKIIEAHDGNILFETRENEGTDFYVEMPITSFEKKA